MDNYGLQFYRPHGYGTQGYGSSAYMSNPFLNYSGNTYSGSIYSNYSNLSYHSYPSYSSGYYQNYNSFQFMPNFSSYNLLGRSNTSLNTNYYQNFGSTGFGSYKSFGLTSSVGSYSLYNNYNLLNNTNMSVPTLNYASLQNSLYQQTNYFSNPLLSFNPAQNLAIPPATPAPRVTDTEINISPSKKVHTDGKVLDRKSNGYGEEFLAKVKKIAQNLKCNYRDLLAVMNAESGIKTTAVNGSTNATGLIQFIPSTAKGLGTSVEQLKNMTPIEQLDYVEKYLQQTKSQAGFSADKKLSGGELYALVFRPAKAKTGVFAERGEAAYHAGGNANLDINKDGKITLDEMSKRVERFYVSDKSFLA